MDNFNYNFSNMDEVKSIFTTGNDQTTTTTATESFAPSDDRSVMEGSVFSPLAPPFQSRVVAPQEPQVGDIAPSSLEYDMMNLRISDSDSLFEGRSDQSTRNYFMGSRAESVASTSAPGNIWSDNSPTKSREMFDNFEFFLKTLSSANTYASMLTREQTTVLKSIRPELLFEFLQEIARVRDEKRMQRALPHECAFCKNNGENEENYSSHALKDCRGRVQCPVLRAFHCPRCGATGDRAHTIKYCPTNDNGMEQRQGARRRAPPASYSFGEGSRSGLTGAPPTPAQSPSTSSAFSNVSFWSNYGIN